MKKKRVMAIPACMIGVMLLGGCGAEPYVLTEQEEAVIVNYSASVVSKFNTFQKDGLTYLTEEDTEEQQETETPADSEIENIVEDNATDDGSGTGTVEEAETVGQQATMNDIFGADGLDIVYTGNEIKDSYVEGSVYSIEAEAGKAYMVLYFDITNGSENDIELDNLTNSPTFKASFTAAEGEQIEASVYQTILLNDFSTYLDTIPAGEAKQAVLLFEIPDSVTAVDALQLQIKQNENSYEINL